MPKKIKLDAILTVDNEIIIDDAMLKRSLGLLGVIESYNVDENLSKNKTLDSDNAVGTGDSNAEISELVNNANKIYYGNLTIIQRSVVALSIFKISNSEQISSDPGYKERISSIFTQKFSVEPQILDKIINDSNSNDFESLKNKFLEGDITQLFIFIWEKLLTSDEEDPFETELVESIQLKFGFEPAAINEIKKQGNDRAKIAKSIKIIESGSTAYNKLKAFEKTVLIGLMLGECSRVDGNISNENQSRLRSVLSNQFGITANAASVILEKKMTESIT